MNSNETWKKQMILTKMEINQQPVLLMDKNNLYAKILYLTSMKDQMQLYGQTMIIPLDGEKTDFENEQRFHALY